MTIINAANILYQYQNGTDKVTVYENGTKEREFDSFSRPVFPETIDVKITNYCESKCEFCHENSHDKGKHADLDTLFNVLAPLPKGVELAIGGGNPLSHPDLIDFLKKCKQKGFICNLTINQDQMDNPLLDEIFVNKLIYGLGISVTHVRSVKKDFFHINEHIVIHLINGICGVDDIKLLKSRGYNKFLILGYKNFGRGVDYRSENLKSIESVQQDNYRRINKEFKDCVISFDNLGLYQLNVQRFFSKEKWDTFYMGADGTHSMYIDGVAQKFALNSRAAYNKRISFEKSDILSFFKNK